MQAKLLHEAHGQRTFAVVLQSGDEALGCLKAFADREGVTSAQLSAVGAFESAVLGYFDWETKAYRRIPVAEQTEVAAFLGDIALAEDGSRSLHVHVVLGRRDGAALAGHLLEGQVRPTLEVVLTESPAHLHKRHDPESGLALIAPRV
jgi:predicted DNA-binding protein with PD1-like motif